MQKIPIKLNQIWENKKTRIQMLVFRKKDGNRWQCKVLTNRQDIYNGTHKMHERTIWLKFTLIK